MLTSHLYPTLCHEGHESHIWHPCQKYYWLVASAQNTTTATWISIFYEGQIEGQNMDQDGLNGVPTTFYFLK